MLNHPLSPHVRRLMLWTLLLWAPITLGDVVIHGDLPRRADPGFTWDRATGEVGSVDPDAPAAAAGIEPGDRLVDSDGEPIDPETVRALLGGRPATLTVIRGDRERPITFTPQDRPFEEIDDVTSHYGVAEAGDGVRLRTIVTLPDDHGTDVPAPGALFFTQWVSCGSIEYRQGSTSDAILARLARESGRAFVRVERAGTGDSTGPACDRLDYDTEIAHYVEAFTQVAESGLVNGSDVVMIGSSLGSTTAPLVAEGLLARGVGITGLAVQGGGAVTYLERMIQFDRQHLERREGADPMRIHAEMVDRIRFQLAYLVDGRAPDDIARDGPAMAAVRNDTLGLGATDHYGRPFAWHQQAARHDFLSAWLRLARPTLVIYGSFDQFEGRHGHQVITEMLNRRQPGLGRYVEFARMGHDNYLYGDIDAAYRWEDGAPAPQLVAAAILEWLAQR